MNEEARELPARGGYAVISAAFVIDALWVIVFLVMLLAYPDLGLDSSREYGYESPANPAVEAGFNFASRIMRYGNILAILYCAGRGRFNGREPLFPVKSWAYYVCIVLMLAAVAAAAVFVESLDTYERVWMEMLPELGAAAAFIAFYLYGAAARRKLEVESP